MDAGEADAFLHQGIELLKMIVLKGRVTASAVGVNHNGVSAIESFRIRWPAIAVHDGRDAVDFVEAGFEQEAAGAMFVFAGAVTGRAGYENDFFVRSLGGNQANRQGKESNEFF